MLSFEGRFAIHHTFCFWFQFSSHANRWGTEHLALVSHALIHLFFIHRKNLVRFQVRIDRSDLPISVLHHIHVIIQRTTAKREGSAKKGALGLGAVGPCLFLVLVTASTLTTQKEKAFYWSSLHFYTTPVRQTRPRQKSDERARVHSPLIWSVHGGLLERTASAWRGAAAAACWWAGPLKRSRAHCSGSPSTYPANDGRTKYYPLRHKISTMAVCLFLHFFFNLQPPF
jgi:hypothetical protein